MQPTQIALIRCLPFVVLITTAEKRQTTIYVFMSICWNGMREKSDPSCTLVRNISELW